MIAAVVGGAFVAGLLGTLMLAGLVAVIVIAIVDTQDDRYRT
jgi:hypothetical protein